MNQDPVLRVRNLNFYYGDFLALKNISMDISRNQVTAFIGPSGCGKSTFLRLFNRMNDLIPGTRVEGSVLFDGNNLYDPSVDPVDVRRRIGMVFQSPTRSRSLFTTMWPTSPGCRHQSSTPG